MKKQTFNLRNQEVSAFFHFSIFPRVTTVIVDLLVAFPVQLDQANQWHQLFPAGLAPSPRYQHSAAWESDGMYVFGGWGITGPTSDVHFYDRQADVERERVVDMVEHVGVP